MKKSYFYSEIRASIARTSRPITVTLGDFHERVDEAFANPRPNEPAAKVFERLRAHHAARAVGDRDEDIFGQLRPLAERDLFTLYGRIRSKAGQAVAGSHRPHRS